MGKAVEMRSRLRKAGIEVEGIVRVVYRIVASERTLPLCYLSPRRTRTGRRDLPQCLTTCLLVVLCLVYDTAGGLLAISRLVNCVGLS